MPKSEKQKQKLLYIEELLRTRTDEDHAVTTPQIIDYLEQNDIKAERKSIYDDIRTLSDFGLDIIRGEGPRSGYSLASREFELAEVKLLVDLVQSSKFITPKKSRELITKLEGLVSTYDARKLQRQVVVTDRNKTVNENIYYSVDVIYAAMADNTQVTFQYFDWNVKKEMQLRKDGAFYQVSPWLLTWDDENYYLVAYDSAAQQMKHYRVDKMLHITQSDTPRDGREAFDQIDVAAYSKKTFGMFAGEEKTVQLLCDHSLPGVRLRQTIAAMYFVDAHFSASHIHHWCQFARQLQSLHRFQVGNALHLVGRHRHHHYIATSTIYFYALFFQCFVGHTVSHLHQSRDVGLWHSDATLQLLKIWCSREARRHPCGAEYCTAVKVECRACICH